jgi:hypothetical protein
MGVSSGATFFRRFTGLFRTDPPGACTSRLRPLLLLLLVLMILLLVLVLLPLFALPPPPPPPPPPSSDTLGLVSSGDRDRDLRLLFKDNNGKGA